VSYAPVVRREKGILRVGDGRGFVVTTAGMDRIVVTAAHCLPHLPPPHLWSEGYAEERTYAAILGPLGGETGVWAECLFADPVLDIAVLGSPDGQDEKAEAYKALVAGAWPFRITDAPKEETRHKQLHGHGVVNEIWVNVPKPGRGTALVLSLVGAWIKCTVARRGAWLQIEDDGIIKSGMSGSPIISPAGHAIGALSTGSLNPVLTEALPPGSASSGDTGAPEV
jgi:hypothetical protein